MEYLVYARKYRPKTFEDMIGQKAVVQTLQNAIKGNRVAQAYLFSGMRGVGKTTAARILAKALNCANGPTPTPCNVCESCREIDDDRSIDVLEIDGASNRGIDDIRSLRESVKYKALRSRTKIIYIDEVHQITKDAFNALLKTLEEPPPNTVFIFATTEFNKVPATIVSRCQHFEFKRVSHREIVHHLNGIAGREGLTVSVYGLGLIAEASDGSIRDAQSLLDQAVSFCGETIGDADLQEILGVINRSFLFEFSTAVIEEKADVVFALTDKVVETGHDLRHFYKELVRHFRNLLLVRTVENPGELLVFGPEDMARLKAEASKASTEEWLRWLQALQNAEGGLKFASHPQIYFETILVRLSHFKKIIPIRDLLQEIEEMKKGEGASPEPRRTVPPAPPLMRSADHPAVAPSDGPKPPAAAAANTAPRPAGKADDPAPAIPENGPPRREPRRDMALKDPSVNLFMKKFKARMQTVEPPSTGHDEEK
jgi:DNA polymerase III subunit gamma/tau